LIIFIHATHYCTNYYRTDDYWDSYGGTYYNYYTYNYYPANDTISDVSPTILQVPTWIDVIDRVIASVPVEVDAAPIADGVPGHEPPGVRVVEAVGEQKQARLHIRVIPRLRLIPPWVRLADRAGARPVAVVEVGG